MKWIMWYFIVTRIFFIILWLVGRIGGTKEQKEKMFVALCILVSGYEIELIKKTFEKIYQKLKK